ncbi:MAG: tripartite tricarboxylate transporter substrate binding protein [Betaproteobacteria bacterium]|jgi:tripartite-type tricarboxylate transporter receptor subunit TctC|nr:tripartite tricarboxylate transporter substrate binding protein [Polynucleobacter sp.]NBY62972.1 tripartite tricarboxylate transporter substrate binding protein [Betaproteobacteria bacterium]
MTFKNWLIFLLVSNFGFVLAQTADTNYPTKPIRIIIPQSSGSATDSLIRLIAPKLTEQLGQSLILENRLGAGGIIGADTVAKAAPDGYTLLIGATSWITIAPHVYPKLSYDPIKDFSPISLFAVGQNVLAVPANSPYTSLKDLVSQMKAQPNILNMASAGIGSTSHLAGVMLTSLAGVSAVHVPYKGAGPSVMSLLSGESQWVFTPMQGPIALIRSGKLRALAVGGSVRSAILPDVPTVKESDIAGYDMRNWYGLLAPAGTSKAIIDKLNTAIVRAVQTSDIREQFAGQGSEPTTNSASEFTQFIREETARMASVVKTAGVKIE